MSARGYCQYRFNPSELYQRTKPGTGVETTCGAATYPAADEPELAAVRLPDGASVLRPTGRLVERGHADPYCPAHGGSPEPPPPIPTVDDLNLMYEAYSAALGRFQSATQAVPAAPAAAVVPALPASPVAAQPDAGAAGTYIPGVTSA